MQQCPIPSLFALDNHWQSLVQVSLVCPQHTGVAFCWDGSLPTAENKTLFTGRPRVKNLWPCRPLEDVTGLSLFWIKVRHFIDWCTCWACNVMSCVLYNITLCTTTKWKNYTWLVLSPVKVIKKSRFYLSSSCIESTNDTICFQSTMPVIPLNTEFCCFKKKMHLGCMYFEWNLE